MDMNSFPKAASAETLEWRTGRFYYFEQYAQAKGTARSSSITLKRSTIGTRGDTLLICRPTRNGRWRIIFC